MQKRVKLILSKCKNLNALRENGMGKHKAPDGKYDLKFLGDVETAIDDIECKGLQIKLKKCH